jgi:hypothetical protein
MKTFSDAHLVPDHIAAFEQYIPYKNIQGDEP